jgi:dolichol-phosphate mannosyltransferase
VRQFSPSKKQTADFTSQFFFADDALDRIYAIAPYNARGQRTMRNGDDGIFSETLKDGSTAGSHQMLAPKPAADVAKLSTGDGVKIAPCALAPSAATGKSRLYRTCLQQNASKAICRDCAYNRRMLSVIIPAFNEERTLAQVLDRVLALPLKPQVIVVSDGSTDGTNDIIRDYQNHGGITGIICPVNGGKGAAIMAGLKLATEPFTIIQDADLEYSPEQFDLLLDPVRANKAQIVYGSRNLRHPEVRENHFHYIRFWLGGKVVTLVANLLFGAHLTDEPTCYKLFPTHTLREMNLQCRGFDFCPEVTAKAWRMGYRIHEVPIKYDPRDMSEGKKIRAWHGIQAIWVLLKYRLMPEGSLFKTRLGRASKVATSTEKVRLPAPAPVRSPVAVA